MADLEGLIRKRVADHRFDDPIRVAPPPVERTKKEVALDDGKAAKVRKWCLFLVFFFGLISVFLGSEGGLGRGARGLMAEMCTCVLLWWCLSCGFWAVSCAAQRVSRLGWVPRAYCAPVARLLLLAHGHHPGCSLFLTLMYLTDVLHYIAPALHLHPVFRTVLLYCNLYRRAWVSCTRMSTSRRQWAGRPRTRTKRCAFLQAFLWASAVTLGFTCGIWVLLVVY